MPIYTSLPIYLAACPNYTSFYTSVLFTLVFQGLLLGLSQPGKILVESLEFPHLLMRVEVSAGELLVGVVVLSRRQRGVSSHPLSHVEKAVFALDERPEVGGTELG